MRSLLPPEAEVEDDAVNGGTMVLEVEVFDTNNSKYIVTLDEDTEDEDIVYDGSDVDEDEEIVHDPTQPEDVVDDVEDETTTYYHFDQTCG